MVFLRDSALAIFYQAQGNPEAAQEQLDRLFARYGDGAAYQYSQIHAQWGEKEKALRWLETAVEIHDPGVQNALGDKMIDPLRDEPGFRQVLKAAGFF